MKSVLVASLFAAGLAAAQTITTVAGGGPPDGISALKAAIAVDGGNSIAVDRLGNLYMASRSQGYLYRVAPDGTLTKVAGRGSLGSFSGDGGPAASASVNPYGVAVDSSGSLYFSDLQRIRKISGGIVTTIAGTGYSGNAGDGGLAKSGKFYDPRGIAVDADGNLYIADVQNHRVRKIAGGILSTIAGNGVPGYSGDGGAASAAQLNYPYAVAVDASDNVYIADTYNNRIRKVSGGIITTIAGGGTYYPGDGLVATAAQLRFPWGVATDPSGNVYVAETEGDRVRKVSGGVITTLAGTGAAGFSGDGGPAAGAMLLAPLSIAVDAAGNVYIADGNHIREVTGGIISTVAGNGSASFSGDGGPASEAQFNQIWKLAIDSSGSLYIADLVNSRVRRVSGGVITTVAGNGVGGYAGDGGPAVAAKLYSPMAVGFDGADNLYILEFGNNAIRKVSNGVISTVPLGGVRLAAPYGLAVDKAGTLYVADPELQQVLKISNGVTTVAAGNGTRGYSGDGGPAAAAQLNNPIDVALDPEGNLFIADSNNNRVRKVTAGIIATVAGNGQSSSWGDGGPATSAALDQPMALAVDPAGSFYIAQISNSVRRVSAGVITTVAGSGIPGFAGDGGPATSAELNEPLGLALDRFGDLYISESSNSRVRQVHLSKTSSLTADAVSPATGAGSNQTMTFSFTDLRGWQDIDVANVLINSALDGRHACYLAYSRPLNVLYLVNDAGTGLLPGVALNGAPGAIANSQCSVTTDASAPTAAGNTLTLKLNFTFADTFGGNRLIYLAARDIGQGNSGWQPLGTWYVPGAAPGSIAPAGVSPARGSGSGPTLTFTFTDTKGWTDIGTVNILINNALDGRSACYLAYSRSANVLYLVNDAGTGLLPGLVNGLGSTTNNQCTVSWGGLSLSAGGNSLTLTFTLSFTPSFAGNRIIYLAARDNGDIANSGWQAMGTWLVQ